jgi:hypothetical protein
MRRIRIVLAAAVLLGISSTACRASENVWSGLVVATNVERPEPAPAELNRLENTLKELFGYNQFALIGQARKTLSKGDEDWMASSKYFALKVDSRGSTSTGYQLNLQLFQEKNLLLETEAKLSKKSPLVIKGPLVGNGQLLLLLVVQ